MLADNNNYKIQQLLIITDTDNNKKIEVLLGVDTTVELDDYNLNIIEVKQNSDINNLKHCIFNIEKPVISDKLARFEHVKRIKGFIDNEINYNIEYTPSLFRKTPFYDKLLNQNIWEYTHLLEIISFVADPITEKA
jgi:hypothetical protein